MLTALSIRDVVLIETLDLEFGDGLGVLTGETGAGKSILLDALGLALGARADAGLVRNGEDSASVTAGTGMPTGAAPSLRFCPASGLRCVIALPTPPTRSMRRPGATAPPSSPRWRRGWADRSRFGTRRPLRAFEARCAAFPSCSMTSSTRARATPN